MALSSAIAAIETALAHVAGFETDPRNLTSSTGLAPPLYIWERKTIVDAGATHGVSKKRSPKSRATMGHSSMVHCWGANENDCESMFFALLRALREQTLVGYHCKSADWSIPAWTVSGFVLSANVTIFMPMPEVVLPTSTGAGIPATDVTNDTPATVEITVLSHDPTGQASGDGYLQTGEG